MKKILLTLLFCGLLPSLAAAAEKPFDFMGNNPDFLKKYMHCSAMRSAAKDKPAAERTCEQKNALKYCDWADKLPDPIKKKVELDLACDFLAGEIKGNDSPDDLEVMSSMKAAGCMEAAGKSIELLRIYFGKENEMRALLFFAGDYSDGELACYKRKAGGAKPEVKKEEAPAAATEPKKEEPKKEEPKPEAK